MKSYDNIINRNEDLSSLKEYGKPADYHDRILEVPESGSRTYEPYSVHKSAHRPSGGSWSQVKKSGVIKMTPMSANSVEVENYLGAIDRNVYYYLKTCLWVNPRESASAVRDMHSSYTEQGDLAYWRNRFPDAPFLAASIDNDASAVERAKLDALSDVQTAYKAGEEIGELPKTIAEIAKLISAVRHPIRSYREARTAILKSNKADKAALIGDLWMRYRYSIMPIAYSIQDIIDVHEGNKAKGRVYRTARRTVNGAIHNPESFPNATHFYQACSGSVTTKVTARAVWESATSRSYSIVDANLFTTAWELIPLSFVVDWFVNIGDYIAIKAKSVTSTGSVSSCVAVKTSYQTDTYLSYRIDEKVNFSRNNISCGSGPITYSVNRGGIVEGQVLLQRTTVDNYARYLYSTNHVKLSYSPLLNWKRGVDASILTLRGVQSALRRLS